MNNSIKNWIEEERPREKLMLNGASSLTSAELLAILIQSGTRQKSALDIARELLGKSSGKLGLLAESDLRKLTSIPGIGKAKAVTLLASFELGRRLFAEIPDENRPITDCSQAAALMVPLLGNLKHEECWVVYLNRANKYIGRERISHGGQSSTIIDVKIIVKKAVEQLATGIILFHNHPSGNPMPGKQDIEQTLALKRAAATLDICLVDHIIVAGKKYFSFSNENVNFGKK